MPDSNNVPNMFGQFEEGFTRSIGYCGNNCSKCEIYIATITNDMDLKEEIIKKALYFTGKKVDPSTIFCLGCKNEKSKHRNYLSPDGAFNCEILNCAKEKYVETCIDCPLFPCSKIKSFYEKYSLNPRKAIGNMTKRLIDIKGLNPEANIKDLELLRKWLRKKSKF